MSIFIKYSWVRVFALYLFVILLNSSNTAQAIPGPEYEAIKDQFLATRKTDASKAVSDVRQILAEKKGEFSPNQTRYLYQMVALTQASLLNDADGALATLAEAFEKLPAGFSERIFLYDAKAKVLLGCRPPRRSAKGCGAAVEGDCGQ